MKETAEKSSWNGAGFNYKLISTNPETNLTYLKIVKTFNDMRNLLIILLLSIFSLQGCSNYAPAFQGTEFERYKAVEEAGFDKQKLDEFTKYLKENSETTGMVVLRDGKIFYEYGDVAEVSYIASDRKSVLSMLYGKHVENGTIDLSETIGDLGIDEDDGLLPREKQATVKDILTSRSGVFHIAANGGYDKKNFRARGSVEPGEYFVYNNWDFNVAGHILERKTGKTVYQELEDQLAKPLGFQDWNIKNQSRKIDESKSRYSAYHIYLSTRDMAKIGQLMLNEGEWNGKQIIPKEWVQKTTSTVTPADVVNKRTGLDDSAKVQFSYGYMWWLFEKLNDNPDFEGAYTASGFGGQFITVIPKQKIVIAHKTKLNKLELWGIIDGGMPNWFYWDLIDKLMKAKK